MKQATKDEKPFFSSGAGTISSFITVTSALSYGELEQQFAKIRAEEDAMAEKASRYAHGLWVYPKERPHLYEPYEYPMGETLFASVGDTNANCATKPIEPAVDYYDEYIFIPNMKGEQNER